MSFRTGRAAERELIREREKETRVRENQGERGGQTEGGKKEKGEGEEGTGKDIFYLKCLL